MSYPAARKVHHDNSFIYDEEEMPDGYSVRCAVCGDDVEHEDGVIELYKFGWDSNQMTLAHLECAVKSGEVEW